MKSRAQRSFPRALPNGATVVLGCLLAIALPTQVKAQGQIASGTYSSSGSGPYTYNLSFTDAPTSTSPIGSVWYSWIPGNFDLPGTPTSASAPSGWTATISGHSVQYVASSPASYIQAGQTLNGFSYQATFTPAQLAAMANSGRSDAYSAGLFSDAGNVFVVQPVPEPATSVMLFSAASIFWFSRRLKARHA